MDEVVPKAQKPISAFPISFGVLHGLGRWTVDQTRNTAAGFRRKKKKRKEYTLYT